MRKEKYEIVVSGAAVLKPCCQNIIEIAKELGRVIAKNKCNLVTGATTGVPYYVALGCKEAGGFVIGFSPASSEREHLKVYKLPTDVFDVIVYTGSDYVGRNVIMTKSADGVIIICGRMGTLHEFATAFETQKPIGVLEGTGGIADKIRHLFVGSYRGKKKIVFDNDPRQLVEKLINLIEKEKGLNKKLIKNAKRRR
jgi:uncharacterized protein (TIGR00725 family)